MSDSTSDTVQFGRVRSLIWPIHRHEMKKLVPMLVIFFLISFSYNVLRTMKDTLVVTAQASGAEVIPFIKVYAMFPGAVLMTLLFTRLSNWIEREKVFYIMMGLFLGYFFLFTFVLYPNREFFHPNEFANSLQASLPSGFKGLIALMRNWTFTLFYVMSELWGNIVLFVLFWGFANQITKINEAKRFYGLFGFGANFSGIFAGQISAQLSRKAFNPNLPFGTTSWEQSMMILMTLVLIAGVLTLVVFRYINTKILTDPRYVPEGEEQESKEVKGKLSMTDSFAYLFRSRYLLYITVIVVAYNVVINLVEVVWKGQLHALYPDPADYSYYTNQVSSIIGLVATLAALFVSGNSIRRFGWTFTAMLTPLILLVTSVVFFGLFFFQDSFEESFLLRIGMTPLVLIVTVGSIQNILSRGAKYTVFDATKEMSFVPLSTECKIKGKAAIDGVCNRFGKSGGSFIHSNLLLLFTTFTASAPYVAGILLVIIGFWMVAVRGLGEQFDAFTSSPDPVSDAADSSESAEPVFAK